MPIIIGTKFLDVMIDNRLKWSIHTKYIIIKNKISKSIGFMIKIRPYLNKATLRNQYFTFVYPYLIYCIEVWGNACDIYQDPLIKKIDSKELYPLLVYNNYCQFVLTLSLTDV